MPTDLSALDKAKYAAAKRAAEEIADGMKVGLGTGSTAAWLVRCLSESIRRDGLRITAVPTSQRTAELAREAGIDVVPLEQAGRLDITIDGADEIDPRLDLIKGGGAALLREKIVAAASNRMVVIADPSKRVETLGAFPLPVEIIPFGGTSTRNHVEEALSRQDVSGRQVRLRMDGAEPLRTDEGNHILDLHLERIGDSRALSVALNQIPGVVENGLFVDLCKTMILGHSDGRVLVQRGADGGAEESRVHIDDATSPFRGGA